MKYLPLLGFATLALLPAASACGQPEPLRFSVQFEDAGEIRENSPVFFRDTEIGRVTGVREYEDEAVIGVEIIPVYRQSVYREARFALASDCQGRPCLRIEDRSGDRTEIEEGDMIDARPGWFERLSRRIDELGTSAREALEDAKSGLSDAVSGFEDSPEFQAFKDRLAEAGRDAATLAQNRYQRFVEEDLPKLEEKARAYRDKLEREGRAEEAEIFWKWFGRWAEAVKKPPAEAPPAPKPKPEKEP